MDVPADNARIGFWYAGGSFQTLFSARGLEVCFKHIVVVVCGTGPHGVFFWIPTVDTDYALSTVSGSTPCLSWLFWVRKAANKSTNSKFIDQTTVSWRCACAGSKSEGLS